MNTKIIQMQPGNKERSLPSTGGRNIIQNQQNSNGSRQIRNTGNVNQMSTLQAANRDLENKNQVQTIDHLISGAVSTIDNLIMRSQEANGQLIKDNQLGENSIQNQNGTKLRIKKFNNNPEPSVKLKMAGAASLYRDRDRRLEIMGQQREQNNDSELDKHQDRKVQVQDQRSIEWAAQGKPNAQNTDSFDGRRQSNFEKFKSQNENFGSRNRISDVPQVIQPISNPHSNNVAQSIQNTGPSLFKISSSRNLESHATLEQLPHNQSQQHIPTMLTKQLKGAPSTAAQKYPLTQQQYSKKQAQYQQKAAKQLLKNHSRNNLEQRSSAQIDKMYGNGSQGNIQNAAPGVNPSKYGTQKNQGGANTNSNSNLRKIDKSGNTSQTRPMRQPPATGGSNHQNMVSRHKSGIPNAAKGYSSKNPGLEKKPSFKNMGHQQQTSLQQYHLSQLQLNSRANTRQNSSKPVLTGNIAGQKYLNNQNNFQPNQSGGVSRMSPQASYAKTGIETNSSSVGINQKIVRESMSLNHSGMKQNKGQIGNSNASRTGAAKGITNAASRMLQQKQNKSGNTHKLPSVKGAISPLEPTQKEMAMSAAIGSINGINGQIGQGLLGSGTENKQRSLERNPSVLSRKELIKQEYNLLLETRLPNIMQLMNSEKSLGLGIGYGNGGSTTAAHAQRAEIDIQKNLGSQSPFDYVSNKGGLKQRNLNQDPNIPEACMKKKNKHRLSSISNKQFGKQSVDYDDTDFLQKMFSHVDSDIRNLSKNNAHQMSLGNLTQKDPKIEDQINDGEPNIASSRVHPKATDYNTTELPGSGLPKEADTPIVNMLATEGSAQPAPTESEPVAPSVSGFETHVDDQLEDGGAVYKNQDPMKTYIGMAAEDNPLQDEDILKIDRLQLINASARYQLLSANQQLLDFHLGRIMKNKEKQKQIKKKQVLKEKELNIQKQDNKLNTIAEERETVIERGPKPKFNDGQVDLGNLDFQSEDKQTESYSQLSERVATANEDDARSKDTEIQINIGKLRTTKNSKISKVNSSLAVPDNGGSNLTSRQPTASYFDKDYSINDSTNDLLSLSNNGKEKILDRVNKMGQPHAVMQDRLNSMNPLMFGDTIRLPFHI